MRGFLTSEHRGQSTQASGPAFAADGLAYKESVTMLNVAMATDTGTSIFRNPGPTPQYVDYLDGHIKLRGDDTGKNELYLAIHDTSVLIAQTLSPLLTRLRSLGSSPMLSPIGISHLMHDGVLAFPHTVYDGIYRLGPGDRAVLTPSPSGIRCDFRLEFPYYGRLSRECNAPDTARLLALLTGSLEHQLGASDDAILMLSSGKDSTSIALAASELGLRGIHCLTYSAGANDDEHLWAAQLCRRLGLKHETVTLDIGVDGFASLLENYFSSLVTPWVDPATLPYLLCIAQAGVTGGCLIDGSGNDIYMGYLPSPEDRFKRRFTIGSVPGADMLKRVIPHHSKLSYLLRNRLEIGFGGRFFRYTDTRTFFNASINTTERWHKDWRDFGQLDPVDFRALIRGRHYEQGSVMGKVRAATRFCGARTAYPFIDPDLIDYYFHLPESARFDRKRWINKTLLRRMLIETIGYDATMIGKRYFQFDGALFVKRYRQLITDEIEGCSLWNREIGRRLQHLLSALDHQPYVWHSIVCLFQISAWHNHSRFAPRV